MFGLSKKNQATKSLQRGTKAILNGEIYLAQQAEEYGLNDKASSWIYTEALVHQIYVLILIFNGSFGKSYKWATPKFAWKVISEVITDHELQGDLASGSMVSFIFRRCAEVDALSGQERSDGEQFRQSARKVAEFDSRADKKNIAIMLDGLSRQCFDNAMQLFG